MNKAMHSDKQMILNAVCDNIRLKLPNIEADLCSTFAQEFFGTMSSDDFTNWSVEDLYGATLNFWSLLHKNSHHQVKVKIYNPDYEKYGWQSTHTVIEILCPDMPFLVESMRMVINRLGIGLYLSVHMGGIRVSRDESGEIIDIIAKSQSKKSDYQIEAPLFFLVSRQTDATIIQQLNDEIVRVIQDNQLVVRDWLPMRQRIIQSVEDLNHYPSLCAKEDIHESQDFLKWIENHHFTIMGVCDYELVKNAKNDFIIQPIKGSGLGILSDGRAESHKINISQLPPAAIDLCLSHQILIVAKTELKSSVHRDTFIDYIGVKRFNDKGDVIGERRIYGLFTSAAYYTYIRDIPLLRQKVQRILKNSGLDPRSHAGRILINILETMPRDDLIQGSEQELLEMTQGIRYLQDRKRVQLFSRADIYNRFISCLVYVPKEIYNSEYRESIESIFNKYLPVSSIIFSTMFTESVLARVHFMIHLKPNAASPTPEIFAEIEQQLIEAGRTWIDDLSAHLIEAYGEEKGNFLFDHYKNSFTPSYTSYFNSRSAVIDIRYLEALEKTQKLQMNFYKPIDEEADHYRIKLYQAHQTIPLSDILPIIENLGLRAISERPFVVTHAKQQSQNWINEFALVYPGALELDLDSIREPFQEAFLKIWQGEVENDGFNRLILKAGLNYRQVMMLRAYAKYFKQLGITYSHDYIETALFHQVNITQKVVKLFETCFDPEINAHREDKVKALRQELMQDLESVANLDEDKIIRLYIDIITNTLRTNYYQESEGHYKTYVSFKFDSKNVPRMPRPYPKYEIFVYSPRFEAIHLRCGDVSRGGLRWSDRKEDFRTEVLGLMKAQQVKNSVIVPNGAKGGFVPKQLDACRNRDEYQAEAVACYQSFIRGLLDITDNYIQGEVVRPQQVVCYDAPDPYLVVAADKGTATFSDYANAISKDSGWFVRINTTPLCCSRCCKKAFGC